MKRFDVTYDVLNNKPKIISIIKSAHTLVIRMHQEADFSKMMLSAISDNAIKYKVLFNVVSANTYVVSIDAPTDKVSEIKKIIANNKTVRFAGYGFKTEKNKEPIIYTENIFIQFNDDLAESECEKIIHEHKLAIKMKITFLKNSYFVSTRENTGDDTFTIAESILNRRDIKHCHPELIYHKVHKTIHPNQWHLKKTTVRLEVEVDASANVENAHKITLGKGTTIAVIDDGFDLGHPEFGREGKIVHPCNLSGVSTDDDPTPGEYDTHGTPCAGVACADGRYGASGVAPEAHLMPIRQVEGLGSLSEALAFVWAADNGADVISCSWGPSQGMWSNPDDPQHEVVATLPALTRMAIDYAVKKGRKGKGCVILFAAGNGNESVEKDGYASYEAVIAVAACNDRSIRSVYSNYGKSLWCAFPSDDSADPMFFHPAPLTTGIWTTDLRRGYGENPGTTAVGDIFGNYINNFGGTSSACPGAAGVAALIISVNPSLSYQEVKGIIRDSCDKIDEKNGYYDENGHSEWYGYGRVNAEKAVILATEWEKDDSDVV
ncbi:subtilisin/kexin-like protease [Yersinia aldovae]|uniref:S8 family peptidase n=1 Tax=Yersinia aldovae TaxID=29483 RepID=UPI0005DB19BE|nr:S8 family serine peptidase [Yersinia aldovae]CNH08928.1 subtilisin/kexin-like protease [Yersinia aldovae]